MVLRELEQKINDGLNCRLYFAAYIASCIDCLNLKSLWQFLGIKPWSIQFFYQHPHFTEEFLELKTYVRFHVHQENQGINFFFPFLLLILQFFSTCSFTTRFLKASKDIKFFSKKINPCLSRKVIHTHKHTFFPLSF